MIEAAPAGRPCAAPERRCCRGEPQPDNRGRSGEATMAADQRGLCIGLDVGTSGVKAVLVAEDGAIVSSAVADYPLLTPRPGWTEQEPEAWWRASCEVLHRLVAETRGPIEAIGLTGQMHGAVFLDCDGGVIRP